MKQYFVQVLILFIFCCSQVVADNQKKVLVSSLGKKGWYENDVLSLRKQIKSLFTNLGGMKYQNIKALILPHAGYEFSGKVAADAISKIRNSSYKRVLILGPSHTVYMRNKLSVPDYTHYKTPLGEIELDIKFINKLISSSYFEFNRFAHKDEHSVQIVIPILQYIFNKCKIVPIIVGQIDFSHISKIASLLKSLIDDDTLVVVSSDFSHYGPRFKYQPFKTNIKNNLQKLDLYVWELIKYKNLIKFYDYTETTKISICGKYPIFILLAMLDKTSKGELINYDTSGNILNDYTNSVSYLSAAFLGRWKKNIKKGEILMQKSLIEKEKVELLLLAKQTLEFYLQNGKIPEIDDLKISITDGMKQVMGAFVTLHKNGDLRGCIGEIFPRRELYKAVMDHAVNSAVNDYRFNKVTLKEFPLLDFEISALTQPETVQSYRDIILGKHGIVLKKHGRSAVFLPQVAIEQGWDMETTLSHLAVKAGLSADDWKEDVDFLVFEAIVFSE